MKLPQYLAATVLFVTAVCSLGELPPYVYKEQQEKAEEALVVKLQSVKAVETKLPEGTQSTVEAVGLVEKVQRTKSGVSPGNKIRIVYTRMDRNRPFAGQSEIPILSENQTYQMFL